MKFDACGSLTHSAGYVAMCAKSRSVVSKVTATDDELREVPLQSVPNCVTCIQSIKCQVKYCNERLDERGPQSH